MDWKELPGNYDDFQHEIVHVKSATLVVKSFLDEYIQHEVCALSQEESIILRFNIKMAWLIFTRSMRKYSKIWTR